MDRRLVLSGIALLGTSSLVLAQAPATPSVAGTAAPSGAAGFATVKTAAQYYSAVLPRAELSLSTSQLGIERCSHKGAVEFAGFELGEAITVNMVLKDIGAASPAPDAHAQTTLDKIKGTAKGGSFDKAYIAFQLENHEYLRDLADAYLHNTAGTPDMAEKQGRQLASLMLAVFKEHVALCKRITSEL